MDKVGQRLYVEAEFHAGYIRQQLGAGFILRLVEFVTAAIATKMFGVSRRKESALMVIKPPGHAGRTGIFEIDNGVFVAVKESWLEGLPCAVSHPRKVKFRAWMDALAKETIEQSRRRRAVEASIVIAQTNLDWICHRPHPPPLHSEPNHTSKVIKDVREPRECQDEIGGRDSLRYSSFHNGVLAGVEQTPPCGPNFYLG